jgi:hypothetical protein
MTTASDNEPGRLVKDIEQLFLMVKDLPHEYQPILIKIVFILTQLEQR